MKNKINRCLLILCVSTMLTSVGRGERPNIIMFLIDDQNPSSIAAFGGDTYTPNLDRMAEEGIKFTRAYVSSSVCTPSRYSFLTGRYAGNSYSKLYLEVVGRPFGEFIPGGNAAEPGQIDKQIEIVKQLTIKGKTITVPEDLKKNFGVSEEPNQDDKAKRKKKREARKKTRKEAKR